MYKYLYTLYSNNICIIFFEADFTSCKEVAH